MPGKVASRCAASSRQCTTTDTHQLIRECRFKLLHHLLYFIDLTPPDFCVFQSLKDSLCVQTLNSDENVTYIKKWVKQLGEFSSWMAQKYLNTALYLMEIILKNCKAILMAVCYFYVLLITY